MTARSRSLVRPGAGTWQHGRMRTRLALTVAAALVLTGCTSGSDDSEAPEDGSDKGSGNADNGGEELEGKELVLAAVEAMQGLESVRFRASFRDAEGETSMDARVDASGNCHGTMTLAGEGSFEVLVVDDVPYFKGDDEFWASKAGQNGQVLRQLVGDKWVIDSSDPERFGGFGTFCDLESLLPTEDDASDSYEDQGEGEVDGVEAVKLGFTDDDGNEGVTHVAKEEPHYLLATEVEGESYAGFSEFDEELDLEKPAPADVHDLAEQ